MRLICEGRRERRGETLIEAAFWLLTFRNTLTLGILFTVVYWAVPGSSLLCRVLY